MATWKSYRCRATFENGRAVDWTRFAPTPEDATAAFMDALVEQFPGDIRYKATVEPCADPRAAKVTP